MDAEYKKFLVVKAVETLVRDRVDALAFGSTGESLTEMESEAVTPKKPTSAIQFMVASRTYAVEDGLHVPAGITPGEYVLGYRWDAEMTSQVWSSCADITIE